MKPDILDFELTRGDTLTLRVFMQDAREEPFDASGFTQARWWVATSVNGEPLIEKDTSSGVFFDSMVVRGKTRWYLNVSIFENDTKDREDMPPATYYHECEIRNGSGTVLTVFNGSWSLLQDLVI